MGIFKKNCEYCRKKITKGEETIREVKALGFVGTKKKAFCCSDHADGYEKELEGHLKKPKKGGCC